MKKFYLLLIVSCVGCSPIAPPSDAQIKTVTERCTQLGLSVKINIGTTSTTIECVRAPT